ncbi:putative ATP-grasp superfamily ATP-dependent carboligase [Pseudaminobacter salicylatoxidans]|uniref:Putative ATP-grasp superfamily ATP-dependent carboligase n=1 Tax=Pseudaminobacter salicylatoxidans TaxID=93369 RepID=A0A316BZF8_PSESE|nr:ATP-grasp domain-containing protein [Pseudaminobacter salicylatoxidans]PWJ80487.1 putative ATP-grasp superfamily ATP-dependent carboligase [Pseudaminobacter salicylatoxidans]
MRARSQSNSSAVLIAAISGRALAAAARRAGYRALVADFFCDDDTRALAERTAMLPGDLHKGIDPDRIISTLTKLSNREEPLALICGSGFERLPGLIDTLAARFPLAGCAGDSIRRVKDPERFAADCAELGIPHPEIRRQRPDDPHNWLLKRDGGAGGTHIGRANGDAAAPGRYFQRFVEGSSVSALFVGDGSQAHVVGFSRQFASPTTAAPYRYGGAVRLRRLDRKDAVTIESWLSLLTRRCNLVGLCSADLIRNAQGYHLLEINPRPGATLDIFDADEASPMEAHLDAARGKPIRLPVFSDCMASMIAYTDRPLESFPQIDWPGWAADRQAAGTKLRAGDPVCTIFARGPNIRAARQTLNARARELKRQWAGGIRP